MFAEGFLLKTWRKPDFQRGYIVTRTRCPKRGKRESSICVPLCVWYDDRFVSFKGWTMNVFVLWRDSDEIPVKRNGFFRGKKFFLSKAGRSLPTNNWWSLKTMATEWRIVNHVRAQSSFIRHRENQSRANPFNRIVHRLRQWFFSPIPSRDRAKSCNAHATSSMFNVGLAIFRR